MRDDRAPAIGAALAVLLAVAAAAALYGGFTGAGPGTLDDPVLGDALALRSPDLTAAAVAVTEIGRPLLMAPLAVAVGIWSWWRGRRADAVFVVATMAGASVLFSGLKNVLDRLRPPELIRLVEETSESLPSGHATMSMTVIGSLVVLAWAGLGVAGRVAAVLAAGSWVGAVGATRIYLGVHWFSDVVAGWLVGAAWLAACAAVWTWWRRHRSREPGAVRDGVSAP
ncbi:MAG TPA: phosphatase PAP2 family protein [Pseudonocardia sp.]|nr:phosphatase PAP2 family protein [Pseudonocardia sp.]